MTNFFIFLMTSFLLRKFYEITLFSQRSVPRRSHQKCSISQTYRKSVFSLKFVKFLEAPILWNVFERLLLTFWLQTLVTYTITDFQTVGISRKLQEVVLLKTWFCENTNKFKWKHMQRSRFLHLQLYLKTTPTPALHCEFHEMLEKRIYRAQPNGSFNTCFWKVLADF